MHVFRMATAENTNLKFEFPVEGNKFLVKNFTDGNIYVGLGEGTDKSKMVLIPSKTAEIAAYSQLTANDGTTVIDIEDENIPTYVSATYPVIPAYGKMEVNTLRVSKVQSEGFKPILTDSTTYAEARDSVFIGYMDRPDSIARVYGANPLDERTE